jgi:hypothetical protein
LAKVDSVAALVSWASAAKQVTSTEAGIHDYLGAREVFASHLGHALLGAASATRSDHFCALYTVWVGDSTRPLYIGQTLNGGRRLWDLPLGESHHLANSFPPQVWTRVTVLRWRVVQNAALPNLPFQEATALAAMKTQTVGLAAEHALTVLHRPLFNLKKRQAGGGWKDVDPTTSKSRGAVAARLLPNFMARLDQAWSRLRALPVPSDGTQFVTADIGGAAFPSKVPFPAVP